MGVAGLPAVHLLPLHLSMALDENPLLRWSVFCAHGGPVFGEQKHCPFLSIADQEQPAGAGTPNVTEFRL